MAKTDENIDERIVARLAELGKTKAELYRALRKPDGEKYKQPYQLYWDMFQAPPEQRRPFSTLLQRQVAKFLEWPPDAFENSELAQLRAEHVKREFNLFLEEGGKDFDPDTIDTLQSIVWRGEKWPTAKMFKLLAMIVSGEYGLAHLAQAMQSEADAEQEPEPPRRPRRR